jgi:hypothetical protein
MKETIDEITNLTEEWYGLIGSDHHKDRDCHWYIETKWSYGYPPIYTVHHYGYIVDEIEEECDTYNAALLKLKEILTEEIKQYKSYIKADEEDAW